MTAKRTKVYETMKYTSFGILCDMKNSQNWTFKTSDVEDY
jgi:hypothetical protein